MLAMFIIVSFINAISFIDGIDGLAISIIILLLSMFEFFSNATTDFFIFNYNYNFLFDTTLLAIILEKKKIFLKRLRITFFQIGVIDILCYLYFIPRIYY